MQTWSPLNPFGRDTTLDKPNYYPHAGYHLGDDFPVPIGTAIYAPYDGEMLKVVKEDAKGNVGLFVFIDPKGKTWCLELCHLLELPKLGSYKENDQIARSGNTGTATTGAHLHCALFKDGKRSAVMDQIFATPAGAPAHALVKQMIDTGVIVSPKKYFV